MGCPFHKTKRSLWKKIKSLFLFTNVDTINLKAILDATIDAIITINDQKQIISFNRAAERLFGFAKEEVLGKNVNIIIPEPFHNQHDGYIDHYLKTGEKKIIGIGREVIAQTKDGSILPIDLAVSEVSLNQKRFFTGIIRDIRQKKEAEIAKQKNIRMEAEAAAKNEYISILSHELRTPLTAIQGSLGLLSAEQEFSEKTKELLSIAYRNVERLGTIVKDLLDIEKLQAGKLQLESKPIPLIPLVKEAVATFRLIANKKEIVLVDETPSIDIYVFADYTRLIQVCLNLLSNAIKFSPPGEKVAISLQALQNTVRISVEDHGPGIPESLHPKLFTPFFQIVQDNTRPEGVGLGLYTCKKIIAQFGGQIGFTANTGSGTIFYFELPIYTAPA
ncbi:MAG: PAS domain-containing sensor histidine kinase [Simkania sp.]|nr:PAS domain-containing sensor histidine kinase [Simkania sp.]